MFYREYVKHYLHHTCTNKCISTHFDLVMNTSHFSHSLLVDIFFLFVCDY